MSQVVTKFPTTTTTIVSGWTNPTNAYVEDANTTDSNTNGAEQKYGGWNFSTSDIPEGSTITKVEIGAKHYETNPTDYYHYTQLKYVSSSGSSTWTLVQRTSLTWDWIDITSGESSWDLTKLNNADVRILMYAAPLGGGGCYVETDNEKTYAIVGDFNNKAVKSIGELQVGDKILIYHGEKKLMFSPIVKIEKTPLVQEEVVEIWSPLIPLKSGKIELSWKSHVTLTKKHPLVVFKKEGSNFAGPIKITAEELHDRLLAGEQFWHGHLWFGWTIEMFPIEYAALKTVSGFAYKIVTEEAGNIFLKSLFNHELEFLESKYGLSLKRQAELGPPFLAIAVKTTCYVDAVAIRVTFTPPTQPSAAIYSVGDSITQSTITV